MNRCTLLLAFAGLLLIGLPLSGAAQDPDCIWCQQCMNEERFRTTSDVTGDVEVLRIWANCSAMDEYQCADLIPCEPLHTPEEEALLEAELEALVFAGDRLGLRSLLFSRRDRLEFLLERDLVLLRGSCQNQITGVFVVPDLRWLLPEDESTSG